MTLCVNDSGTWRNISYVCLNDSYTWRAPLKGCINDSGTWRQFIALTLSIAPPGTCIEGGNLVYKSGGTAWIASPPAACVRRPWTSRNDAVTLAQTVSGCTGWFVPTCAQFKTPIWPCRSYICSPGGAYWTNSQFNATHAWIIYGPGPTLNELNFSRNYTVRSFRCVSY